MQISAKYQPKTPDGQQWMVNYHAKLYNLTDEAIRGAALAAIAGHSMAGDRQLQRWLVQVFSMEIDNCSNG